jgi:predicted GNAT family acetyltransferase
MVALDVTRNTSANQFELLRDGEPIGTLVYTYEGDATVLQRIEVDEKYSGQGLAGQFAEAALGQLASGEEAVIPVCPFVRGYMIKHPQWQDLVPPDHRADLSA